MKNRFAFAAAAVFLVLLLVSITAVSAQTAATIDITVSPSSIQPGGTGTVTAHYTIPDHMYMALQKQFFFINIEEPAEITSGPILYPEGIEKNGLTIYKKTVSLQRSFTVPAEMKPGEYSLKISAGYQFCDENGTCYIPKQEEKAVPVTITAAGGDASSAGVPFLRILQYLLFAFIGGIILNVMPCVLPLLSVRALSLVNQSQNDKTKIFRGSMAYTGGILASFIVLATIVTLLKVSGEMVGWGFQFQNPGFVIVLISVIFVFALSMFDVFVISAPGMTAAAKASSRGGYLGSFLTGVFAVLVATPCTAPFLGTALGFAFSQPPVIIFLIFFLVGLGLALPFIILGIWPKFIQKIPKPGNWMTVFKEVMGFLLIGTVVYLLTTLFHEISGQNFIRVLIFLAVLSFVSWLYGKFAGPGSPRLRQWIIFAVIAGIVTVSAVFIVKTGPPVNGSQAAEEKVYISSQWERFTPEKVEIYRRAGLPVFIDFHAAWCTNCKVNRAAVLSKRNILTAFEKYGVKLLHGDFTNNDPVIAEWIQKFGKAGVPVYALYIPGREDPVIFPELLSRNMILSALEKNLALK